MTAILFVAAASIGVLARVGVAAVAPRPLGTIAVNTMGSLALGALVAVEPSATSATVLSVAGLGTLTTVSSAVADAHWLAGERGRPAAVVYGTATVVLSVGAAWLGLALVS